MKKIKKMLSFVSGLLICSSISVPFTSNAFCYSTDMTGESLPESFYLGEDRYEVSDWLNEYMGYPDTIQGEERLMYIKSGTDYDYVELGFNKQSSNFSRFYPDLCLGKYIRVKNENVSMVEEYLKENYPNLTFTDNGPMTTPGQEENNWVSISFPNEMSWKEQLNISLKIKKDIGIRSECAYTDNNLIADIHFAGDVDNDNLLTADDASYVLEYYAKAQTDKLGEYEESRASELALYGDYDGDGIVDANDASYILGVYSKNQAN